jgi:hypothetical protein
MIVTTVFVPKLLVFTGNGIYPTIELRGYREGETDETRVTFFDIMCNHGPKTAMLTINGGLVGRGILVDWFALNDHIVAYVQSDSEDYNHVISVDFQRKE